MNTIHKATLNDVPRLLHLIHGYWKFESIVGFDAERLAPQLERLIREPTLGTAWIGVQDGRVVGYLIAVYVFSIEFMGLVAEFDEFFIEAEGRGNGLGTEMIRVAEEGCRQSGCTYISLQVARNNHTARRFYCRQGFRSRAGYDLFEKILTVG